MTGFWQLWGFMDRGSPEQMRCRCSRTIGIALYALNPQANNEYKLHGPHTQSKNQNSVKTFRTGTLFQHPPTTL